MQPGEPATRDDEIELGEAGGRLRLWKAQEAMRQGELALQSQADNRTNLRTSATSLLGWSVTGVGFTAAAALTAANAEWRSAAGIATFGFVTTASVCVTSLFPRLWASRGYSPLQVMDAKLHSELEITEALATGIHRDIERNQRHLNWMATMVRVCWCLFALTPLAGLATLTHSGQTALAAFARVVR